MVGSKGRVLVTGGAGYVGSHCAKALSDAGFEPVVFDNLSTGHREFCRWGPLIEGDLTDASAIAEAVRTVAPVAAMHFAAQSIVPLSVKAPQETYEANVVGSLNLFRAMLAAGVTKLVVSSTCATYGLPDRVPISEDTRQEPISPYGSSKLMVERMLVDFDAAYDLKSVALRYFNASGALGDGSIGEWHDPETHLIPMVLDVALGLRPAIGLFGTDYATSDGTAVRDYIHVEDLASAHVKSLNHLLDEGDSLALNVGTGTGYSVLDIVRAVEEVTKRKVAVRPAPRRAGDPPILVADPQRAQRALSWRAERGLERIVADAWRWHVRLKNEIAPAGESVPLLRAS